MIRVPEPAQRIVLQDMDGDIYTVERDTLDHDLILIHGQEAVLTFNTCEVHTLAEALLEISK